MQSPVPFDPTPLIPASRGLRSALCAGDPLALNQGRDDVLAALCRSVPGVQAATLSIRDGAYFRLQAIYGYPAALRGLSLPTFTERVWYGLGDDPWRRGVPRTVQGAALHTHLITLEQTFGPLPHLQLLRAEAGLDRLAWNVLVPLALDGQVCAHLNLDGFTSESSPPDLPAGLAVWLSSLLEDAWAQTPGRPDLAAENHALRVIAHLGDTLRPLNDPERILTTGLREAACGFGASDAFILDGHLLRCLNSGLEAPAPADPLAWADGWRRLGYDPLSVICEPCDGHHIGLIWSASAASQELARMALRGVADRVYHATNRAREGTRLRAARQHALAMVGVALEARDLETSGHTRRVASLAQQLGQALSLGASQLEALHLGALLHDLGKIALPDHVLLKPGRLTEDEWEWIRRHPQLGVDLAGHLPGLPDGALDVIRHHHERWDAQGYPHGLAATQIPLLARAFSVVDTYDALTSARPYKAAWSAAAAREEVWLQRARQFDPQMVDAFLGLSLDD